MNKKTPENVSIKEAYIRQQQVVPLLLSLNGVLTVQTHMIALVA